MLAIWRRKTYSRQAFGVFTLCLFVCDQLSHGLGITKFLFDALQNADHDGPLASASDQLVAHHWCLSDLWLSMIRHSCNWCAQVHSSRRLAFARFLTAEIMLWLVTCNQLAHLLHWLTHELLVTCIVLIHVVWAPLLMFTIISHYRLLSPVTYLTAGHKLRGWEVIYFFL